jgi:dihydrofolate reductase
MLSIIVAVAENNSIGKDNNLLWRLPGDLKRFKEITDGNTIVMGRKTFLSLPKVLPNRHHIVITRDKNFSIDDKNVTVINSLETILEKYSNNPEEVFIIGGGEIYASFFPYVGKIYLTEVYKNFNGDTFFPEIDYSKWEKTYESPVQEENNLKYKYTNLIKREH